MSLVADALQPHLIRGLMSLENRVEAARLADVTLPPQKAGYDLDFIGKTISIDFRQSGFLTPILIGDSWRFISAAFQTVAKIRSEIVEKETLPWSLIRLYYAAFYAAHALVRLFGESCSRFDQKHIRQLTTVASSQGKSSSLEIGQYHCALNASASGFQAKLLDGGLHESFWGMFGEWIERMANAVAANRGSLTVSEAQQVVLKLEKIRDITKSARLSATRNRLQYRHELGVWFPTTPPKRDREALGRLVAQWDRDPMTINLQVPRLGELGEFVISCTFILALCRMVLKRIEERSTVGQRSFVHYGPLTIIGRVGN